MSVEIPLYFTFEGEVFVFDLCTSYNVQRSWTVTNNPTESGVLFSDHAQQNGAIVTMTVGMTRTPFSGYMHGLGSGDARITAAAAWLKRVERKLVGCVTSRLGSVVNLILARVSAPYSGGGLVKWDLEWREVQIAEAVVVTVTTIEDTAATAAAAGESADTSSWVEDIDLSPLEGSEAGLVTETESSTTTGTTTATTAETEAESSYLIQLGQGLGVIT